METSTTQATSENKLTFGQKLKFYFTKPGKVFAEYIEKPKHLVNLLILAVITCITSIMSVLATKDSVSKLLDEQLKGMDPSVAEMTRSITNVTTSPLVAAITGLIGLLIFVYLSSAIYLGLTKLFKGEGTYSQMVATYILAYFPVAIGKFISAAYSLVNKKPILNTKGMGIGDTLINAFNVFGLWRIVLFAIGISVVFKLSKKKSAAIVIIIWAILLVFSLLSSGLNQAMQNAVVPTV
jgi:hypothetical protein